MTDSIVWFYKDSFKEDGSEWMFFCVIAIPVLFLIFKFIVEDFLLLLAGVLKCYFLTTNSGFWFYFGLFSLLGLLFFFFISERKAKMIAIITLGTVSLATLIIPWFVSSVHLKNGLYVNEKNTYVLTKSYEYADGRTLPVNTELLATFSKTKEYVTEYTLLVFENDGSVSIEYITCVKGVKPFASNNNLSQYRKLFNQPIKQEYERQKQLFMDELSSYGIKLYQGNKYDSYLLQSIADKKYVEVSSLSFFNDDDNANILWYVERQDYGKYKRLYKKHKRAVCKFSFKYSMKMTHGQYVLYYE